MGQKRKRPIKRSEPPLTSQNCLSSPAISFTPKQIPSHDDKFQHPHPVISLYYPQTLTLRQFLLYQLPLSSKSRRRRITSLKASGDKHVRDHAQHGSTAQSLVELLDTTLIGVPKESSASHKSHQGDFITFTQSQGRSDCTDTGPPCPQSEVM